jgi:hypothetical protein
MSDPTTPAPTPDPGAATQPTTVLQKVEMTGEEILAFIQTILPYLESSLPAVAAVGGPIGMGISAAGLLLTFLDKIPIGPTFTVDQQQQLRDRVQSWLLDFSQQPWQKKL